MENRLPGGMLILPNLQVHLWQLLRLHPHWIMQIIVQHHQVGEVFHQWLIFRTLKSRWMGFILQPTETRATQHPHLVNTRPLGINQMVIADLKYDLNKFRVKHNIEPYKEIWLDELFSIYWETTMPWPCKLRDKRVNHCYSQYMTLQHLFYE